MSDNNDNAWIFVAICVALAGIMVAAFDIVEELRNIVEALA